jgi:hypothetical protein
VIGVTTAPDQCINVSTLVQHFFVFKFTMLRRAVNCIAYHNLCLCLFDLLFVIIMPQLFINTYIS